MMVGRVEVRMKKCCWFHRLNTDIMIAQSLTTHASTQPAVGVAKHHRQNVYLTAMYGHYIGAYFNN